MNTNKKQRQALNKQQVKQIFKIIYILLKIQGCENYKLQLLYCIIFTKLAFPYYINKFCYTL